MRYCGLHSDAHQTVGIIQCLPAIAEEFTIDRVAAAFVFRIEPGAVVHQQFTGKWERKYAVGTAFLRGMGRGRVAAVTGVHETQKHLGPSVVEAKLPTIGALKNDSYEGDGYAIVKDPSTDVVKKMLKTVIETVRVHYAG